LTIIADTGHEVLCKYVTISQNSSWV